MKKGKYHGLNRTDLLELLAAQLELNEQLQAKYQALEEEKVRQDQIIAKATSQKDAWAKILGLYLLANRVAK